MFQFIFLKFFPIFQPSSSIKLPSLHVDHPPEFPKTIHQDQISDLLVNHYDCREHPNVSRFSFNRVDDCCANPQDVANNEARVDLYIRAKTTTITGYQCSLSYTKVTKVCGYNANITMTAKVFIKKQCLDTMPCAATTVKIMFVIFCIFPRNTLTELSKLLNQSPFSQIPINKNQEIKIKETSSQ